MSCEYCWNMAHALGIEYSEQLARSEREHQPCTANTVEGAKLRAGQFWDEETQSDRRLASRGSET